MQCADPLRRDIEPAMLWRPLPAVVAHALRLPGNFPLAIPWCGVFALIFYTALVLRRGCADSRFVFGGTLLLATTSAVLVPLGWMGINDAWVWLGLMAVAFGRWTGAAPIACLLCPWIDERFIIGLPLACLAGRNAMGAESWRPRAQLLLWLLPYGIVRTMVTARDPALAETLRQFGLQQLSQNFRELPVAPLGWWMGLRAGWVAVAVAIWLTAPARRMMLLVALAATAVVSALLASDLSRSIAIATPLMIGGCVQFARARPDDAARWVLGLGLANLVIPAAHVTFRFIDPIHPLPVELFRVLR